ncbi:MAG: hypothetical protein JRI96_04350 [Deltaproteobacteria bacterium]|nr:hypothetical protein [Deltaproteobacteria bacterium]
MRPVFLFKRTEWNKKTVTEFLDAMKMDYDLRYGFSYILAIICEKSGFLNAKNLDSGAMADVRDKIPPSGILCVHYDSKRRMVSTKALLLNKDAASPVDLDVLLKGKNDIEFDLANFGFSPMGGARVEDLYKSIRSSDRLSPKVDILAASECEDIINNPRISEDIRKIVLDVFTLRAAAILVALRLHHTGDVLSQYSEIFLLSYITRAQFEKLTWIPTENYPTNRKTPRFPL